MKYIFLLLTYLLITNTSYCQLKIGAIDSNSSAALEISSTEKGFLPPRMTNVQRDNISRPPDGLIIWCNNCGRNGELQVFNGTAWTNLAGGSTSIAQILCSSEFTTIVDIRNPFTGKTWMDRNLGASRRATNRSDQEAYGDLYQWGRRSDGHQCRTSTTTTVISSTAQPDHGNFIISNTNNNWLNPSNTDLWQGENGINNPCPSGYRLPTEAEWQSELNSWSAQTIDGAFNMIGLPAASRRNGGNGEVFANLNGYYWSSTITSDSNIGTSRAIDVYQNGAGIQNFERTSGLSVRCMKNE
jgi:uncharacterized protein (TIGR02145 family)